MSQTKGQWMSVPEAARALGVPELAVLLRLTWGAYGARLTPEGRREVRIVSGAETRDPLGDTAVAGPADGVQEAAAWQTPGRRRKPDPLVVLQPTRSDRRRP